MSAPVFVVRWTRSTGKVCGGGSREGQVAPVAPPAPSVFHAEDARVSQSAQSGPIALSFRLGTHSVTRLFVDVRLVLESGDLRSVEVGRASANPPAKRSRRARVALNGRPYAG